MDILTIVGILLGVIALAGGQVLEGGHLSSIMQITAAIIVFGGTIGATFVNYPASTVITAIRLSKKAFISQDNNLQELIDRITGLAQIVRKDGLLAIEHKIKHIDDPFLRRGVQLLVDGRNAEEIRCIMEIELNQYEEKNILAAKVFESAGGYAPTIGILGAVLGLIHVMENLAAPSKLGSGIAVAFVATVYGVGSANLFWIPLAGKLKVKIKEENVNKALIIEGLTSIAEGETPSLIHDRLEGFLAEAERRKGKR